MPMLSTDSYRSGLYGHNSLQMTSEVISEVKFEFSGLKNLCFTGFVVSMYTYLIKFRSKGDSGTDTGVGIGF